MVVYQPATGREVTAQLQATIDSILAAHAQIDGAILKSKSPSCGLFDTKIYQGIDKPQFLKKGGGLFGEQVFLRPYPRALDGLSDSGRGREVP